MLKLKNIMKNCVLIGSNLYSEIYSQIYSYSFGSQTMTLEDILEVLNLRIFRIYSVNARTPFKISVQILLHKYNNVFS